MDGQQYLNQISEPSRSAKPAKGKGGILSSKFFLVGVIGVVSLIIIIIIGSALGGDKGGGEKNLSYKLKLHLDNTAEVANEYQKHVRSSGLRSDGASLYGVLTNTSRELTDYLVQKYNFKDKDIDKKVQEAAEADKEELSNELFEAKINGILDRVYAQKMVYEISLLNNEETQLMKAAKSETLTGLLNTSYESLNNLYSKFNDFSETKN